MKKRALITLLAATALAAQLPSAFSAGLRILDGNPADTVVIEDNSAQDLNPDVGAVAYSGPVGTNWVVTIASGITKPDGGDAFHPTMDLETVDRSGKGGTLTIEFTDTNYLADGMLAAGIGGTGSGASVSMQVWVDPLNTPFGTNILAANLGPISGTANIDTNLPVVITAPYSITLVTIIKASAGGRASYDAEFILTPTPAKPSCPPDVTIECGDSSSPTNPIVGMPTLSTSPDCLPVTANYYDTITMGTNCSVDHLFETIARTWTLNDSCNNTSTCVQVIYVTDTNAPAFLKHPGDINLLCNPQSIPTGDLSSVLATSDCCPPTVTNTYSDMNDGCQWTRTIVYTATDCCGNTSSVSQKIMWTVDTNTPVFTVLPSGSDLGCNPTNIPTDGTISGEVTATDDCSTPMVMVGHTDAPLPSCGMMRTFTISAMDLCNNSTNTTVVYTWRSDTQPPTITCPQDMVVTNPATPPSISGTPYVSDNCDTNPAVTYVDSSTPGQCAGSLIIYRTWSAVDSCGNSNGCVQKLTYYGNTADVSGRILLHCDATSSVITNDVGLSNVVVTLTDTSSNVLFATDTDTNGDYAFNNLAPGTYLVRVTPPNGYNQTLDYDIVLDNQTMITLAGCQDLTNVNFGYADTATPVIVGVQPGGDKGCNPTITLPTDTSVAMGVTASDDRGPVPVVVTHMNVTNGCTVVSTFCISATGTCGNTAKTNVIYGWTQDTNAPVVTVPPGGSLPGCNPSASSLPTVATVAALVTVTDNCSVLSTNISCVTVTNGCTVVRTFTVTATDHCNNTSAPQMVVYAWTQNTTPPMVICPPNVTISNMTVQACGFTQGGWGAPPKGGNPGMILSNFFTKVYPAGYVECGIAGSGGFSMKFTSASNIEAFLPQGGQPAALTADSVNPTTTSAGVFAGQVLALQLNVDFGDAKAITGFSGGIGDLVLNSPSSPLNGKTVRQILAICNVALGGGNISSYGVSIGDLNTLADAFNSAFDNCTPSSWCMSSMMSTSGPVNTSPSKTGYPTVTDGCDTTPTVTYTDVVSTATCGGTIIYRTWTAVDHCGNVGSCTQLISIGTSIPPMITVVPQGSDLGCNPKNLPTDSSVGAQVTATGGATISVSHTSTTNGCAVTLTFTITATTPCGSATPAMVVYTFKSDLVPPTITCPPAYVLTNAIVKPCTFTPGDYGGICNGTNPASILTNCFSKVYTNGYLQCGLSSGGYCAKFTTGSCVQKFVPCTGTPNCLNGNYNNPTTCNAGSFGADVVCLKLNVDLGDCNKSSGFSGGCGDLVYCDSTSPLNGKCVRQILGICNTALGGGNISSYGCTIGDLDRLCTNLNCSFRNCVPSSWCTNHLVPPAVTNVPPSVSGYPTVSDKCDSTPTVTYHDVITSGMCGGAFTIQRTWTAVDACGNSNSCTQTISYGSTSASICGTVFLDCNGDGYLAQGIDAGLSNAIVVLKNSSNMAIATNTTDGNGNYCFYNLSPGTYTVTVPGLTNSYTQTGGTCTNHWLNNSGYDCWYENDGYQHWKNTSGTDCWIANDNCQHYKNSNGYDCWTDKYGSQHQQPCNYTSCNTPNNNSVTVTLTACQSKTGVNFSYAGTSPKATVCITGPASAFCGQTITYTCCVTNTGTLCFNGGSVSVCGNNYTCPPLSPGQGCSFKCNYYVNYYDYPNLNCKATASCSPAYGNQQCNYQGSCNTKVTWNYGY